MKGLLLGLLVLVGLQGLGQSVGRFRYDSTIIEKVGGTNELVIRNKTKDTLGFLYNNGGGVTSFKRITQINDTTFVMGRDTVLIKSAASGGSGLNTLNGLNAGLQTLAIGTSGTAPNWVSATSTHTLNIPSALSVGVLNGTVPYTRTQIWDAKIGPGDTAAMLANYLSGGDTISLSNRINQVKAAGITATIGDVVTSGTSPEGVAITNLVATGAVAGTYTNPTVTIDAKGRVLAIANGSGGGGSGTDNVNGGAGYRLVIGGQVIRSLVAGNGTLIDSTSNTNALTFKADTSILATINDVAAVAAANVGITALTGDVTATGPGSSVSTIANDAVTFAKFQNITSSRLLGRYTTGSGDMQEISLGAGLAITGGVLDVVGGGGTTYSFTAPLSETGGVVSVANGVADGTTKGVASYNAADFNSSAGNISIDYANAQAASAGTKGFLTPTDWATFNNKQNTITLTTTGTSGAATFVGGTLNIPQYSPGTYTAGVRLTLTGNQFNVDTASLLAPYLTAINARVKYSDTSAMLTAYQSKLNNITGLITAGSNVTVTGSGTAGSPYVIASSGGGGGGYIFTPADFNESGSTVSLDYTNGQKANGSQSGFLGSGDWTTFNNKQNTITTGTTAQYFRGDLSLAAFPTAVSSFTNDVGYLTNITGKVTAGSGIGLTGSGTTASPYVITSSAVSLTDGDKGDITVSGTGATWNIDALAVGNAEISDVAWGKITGVPTDLVTLAGVQTLTNKTLTSPIINVTADATGDVYYRSSGGAFTRLGIGSTGQVLKVVSGLPAWAADATGGGGGATLSDGDYGDVTVSGTGTSIAVDAGAITNTKLANMATLTLKGNNTGGTTAPLDLTVAQVNAILPVFTSTLNGLAPLSGGGTVNFLRADGTWAPPASGYSFDPNDFNGTSTITIDYTNGQKATNSIPGFLTAADHTAFAAKQNAITTGTTAQYFRGDLSLATFPTAVSAFTNDAGYISNITGKIIAGTNISITGTGTSVFPYVINATSSGTGTVSSFAFTNGNGFTGSVSNATTTPTLSLSLQDADAGGTTKGQAGFAAVDFNASAGIMSIDWANTQKATGSQSGALLSTDWTTFNNKQGAITLTTTGSSGPATLVGNTLNIPQYTAGAGMTNPMTTFADIIYGGASGTPTRLGIGTSGYVLTSNGAGVAPSWQAATPITYSAGYGLSLASNTFALDTVTTSAKYIQRGNLVAGTNITLTTVGNQYVVASTGGSNWGVSGPDIYRDSKVLIGATGTGSNKLHVYTTTTADGISIDGTSFPSLVLRNAGVIAAYAPAIVTSNTGFFAETVAGDMAFRVENDGTIWLGGANAGASLYKAQIGISRTALKFPQLAGNGTGVMAIDNNGVASWSAGGGGTYTGTSNRITVTGTVIDVASTYVGQPSITTLGTIGTGAWNGTVIAGQYGGTGVANTGKAITLGGNLTTAGAFATTLTSTATTNVTLPTTGTLATLAGAEALTNKSVNGVTLVSGGSTTAFLNQSGTYTTPVGGGSGTVTSVGMTVPAFLAVSGSPITTSGTFGVTLSGSALPAANGGTGQTSYTVGDILYASSTSGLGKLAAGTSGYVLGSNGAGVAPSYKPVVNVDLTGAAPGLGLKIGDDGSTIVVGSAIGGGFAQIRFTVGEDIVDGTTTYLDPALIGKRIEVVVSGLELDSSADNGFTFNEATGNITFAQALMEGQQVRIKAYDAESITYLETIANGSGTYLFEDNFTRSNASTLGSPWLENAANSDWGIASNKASNLNNNTSFGFAAYSAVADAGASDVTYRVNVTYGTETNIRILARYNDENNGLVLAIYEGNEAGAGGAYSSRMQLYKQVSGSFTALGSSVGVSNAAGQTHEIKFLLVGNSVKVYNDGSLIINQTASESAGYTKYGFAVAKGGSNADSDNGTVFDNVRVY